MTRPARSGCGTARARPRSPPAGVPRRPVRAARSFFWGVGFRPSATLTLSVYFHGTAEEIDAVGDDYLLNEATGTRPGEQSTSGQQARLWSRGGALLATTEQLGLVPVNPATR